MLLYDIALRMRRVSYEPSKQGQSGFQRFSQVFMGLSFCVAYWLEPVFNGFHQFIFLPPDFSPMFVLLLLVGHADGTWYYSIVHYISQ